MSVPFALALIAVVMFAYAWVYECLAHRQTRRAFRAIDRLLGQALDALDQVILFARADTTMVADLRERIDAWIRRAA